MLKKQQHFSVRCSFRPAGRKIHCPGRGVHAKKRKIM